MHINVAAAGLLAQVIPTILIFLALEGRVPKVKGQSQIYKTVRLIVRLFAIITNLGVTFGCLVVVMNNEPPPGMTGTILDIVTVVGVMSLFFAACFTITDILMKEIDDHY